MGKLYLDGKEVLADVYLKGTLKAIGTVTLPAVTLGGTVTGTGQEIDAAILDACVAKGAWTASGTWTLPAFSFGGTVSVAGYTLQGLVNLIGATNDVFYIRSRRQALATGILVTTTDADPWADVTRLAIEGGAATAVATWSAITHTGLNITSGQTLKVAGTQVVSARVVDARCDDVVDATYGAEEAGVLDALRDAMVAHGLIAAA